MRVGPRLVQRTFLFAALLLESAVSPLGGWRPVAHGDASGPMSTVLSALVVKVSLYLVWRLWFWLAADWPMGWAPYLIGALPDALLASEPSIPWCEVVAMRHKLAHDDYDVAFAILAATVSDDLPALEAVVGRMLERVGWRPARAAHDE